MTRLSSAGQGVERMLHQMVLYSALSHDWTCNLQAEASTTPQTNQLPIAITLHDTTEDSVMGHDSSHMILPPLAPILHTLMKNFNHLSFNRSAVLINLVDRL